MKLFTPFRNAVFLAAALCHTGCSAYQFSFSKIPIVVTASSIYPSSGSGQAIVAVKGSGFGADSVVTLGTMPCTGAQVVDSENIICHVPQHIPGVVDVLVTSDYQKAQLDKAFTYLPPLSLTGVSPSSGPSYTQITLSGESFTQGAFVLVGTSPCSNLIVLNSTSATCRVPPPLIPTFLGPISVTITNPSLETVTLMPGFTYTAPPPISISGVTPSSGLNTTSNLITLSGTGFTPNTSVTIGTDTCSSFSFINATSVSCWTPATQTVGLVNVTAKNTTLDTYTKSNAYTYTTVPPISITGVSPSSGFNASNNLITLTGISFTSSTWVTIGTVACNNVSFISSTSVSCWTPTTSTVGFVGVTAKNSVSDTFTMPNAYTYLPPPISISSISPSSGSNATHNLITLTGVSFTASTSVTIGTVACNNVSYINSTSVSCLTPITSTVGLVDVTAKNSATDTFTKSSAYNYTAPPPISITGVSPSSGFNATNNLITLTGISFTSSTLVTIGTVACNNVSYISSTSVSCLTPTTSTVGLVGVTAKNSVSDTFTMPNAYTYLPPSISISSVSPSSGSNTTNNLMTLSGSSFTPNTSVTIGSVACSTFVYLSSTSVTCWTPVTPTVGPVDVTAKNSATDTFTKSSAFTYTAPYVPTIAISGVAPSSGSNATNNFITLSGSGFTLNTGVTLGTVACSPLSYTSPTSVSCWTPVTSTLGTVDVTAKNSVLDTYTKPSAFTYTNGCGTLSTPVKPNSATVSTAPYFTIVAADSPSDRLALITKLFGSTIQILAGTLTSSCAPNTIGSFSTNDTQFAIPAGVVMSNGKVSDIPQPATSFISSSMNSGSDADLSNSIGGASTFDACRIEFQFTSTESEIGIREYIFASEEYSCCVGSAFNDAFAFFLRPHQNNSVYQNIALVPGTSMPISINNISPVTNSSLYINNSASTTIAFDGRTTKLEAKASIQPGTTYDMKLVIADVSDSIYDSGVFIRFGSISGSSLSTGVLQKSKFCSGESFWVPYQVFGGNLGADNVFQVQLSDALGSFASPTQIGVFSSTNLTDFILATLPQSLVSGTQYRVRVTATSPVLTGSSSTDNGLDLTLLGN